eukprot:TRINITY_DN19582_c0_g1_i1.p1 TRINITY_DN19582_c0_g1~~TRINITY_DN19582_c0_g1_i1.p1  ORF type:complete len:125 (-),score=7.57 TRINITY_DN19582_c0_g1_i1:103-477(-)
MCIRDSFCNHLYKDHDTYKACTMCKCNEFKYIFMSPEEQGMWWLTLNKDFDREKWKASCKCKHTHDQHDPVTLECECGCGCFCCECPCLMCGKLWSEHVTLYETAIERQSAGKTTGKSFLPTDY